MSFLLHFTAMICMAIPSVLGYNLVFGKGKILHFGPIAVAIMATYGIVLTQIATGSYALGFAAGLGCASVLSLLFAWLSLRLEPDGLGVMSIAMHLMLLTVVLNWDSLTRGALGIPGIVRVPLIASQQAFALVTLVVAIVWIAGMWLLHRSAFGRKLDALAEHEWYAQSQGISRVRVHTLAFLIAGLGMTITAFFLPQYLGLLYPSDYTFVFLILWVMMVVAGGPGSVLGVAASTALLMALKEGLRFLPLPATLLGPVRLILFGLILFAAVWVRRDTLFPQKRSI